MAKSQINSKPLFDRPTFFSLCKKCVSGKNVFCHFLTGAKCKLDQIHKFFRVCVLANALAKAHFSQRLVLALEKDPDDKT
jgi:hypothetical protein